MGYYGKYDRTVKVFTSEDSYENDELEPLRRWLKQNSPPDDTDDLYPLPERVDVEVVKLLARIRRLGTTWDSMKERFGQRGKLRGSRPWAEARLEIESHASFSYRRERVTGAFVVERVTDLWPELSASQQSALNTRFEDIPELGTRLRNIRDYKALAQDLRGGYIGGS